MISASHIRAAQMRREDLLAESARHRLVAQLDARRTVEAAPHSRALPRLLRAVVLRLLAACAPSRPAGARQ